MISIHRIIISNCNIQVDSRELLEAFREALKKNMKASSVLFTTDGYDSDYRKGGIS